MIIAILIIPRLIRPVCYLHRLHGTMGGAGFGWWCRPRPQLDRYRDGGAGSGSLVGRQPMTWKRRHPMVWICAELWLGFWVFGAFGLDPSLDLFFNWFELWFCNNTCGRGRSMDKDSKKQSMGIMVWLGRKQISIIPFAFFLYPSRIFFFNLPSTFLCKFYVKKEILSCIWNWGEGKRYEILSSCCFKWVRLVDFDIRPFVLILFNLIVTTCKINMHSILADLLQYRPRIVLLGI